MDNKIDSNNIQHVMEAWKKTIEVQQHFNDLELRIRNFAVTILGAAIGAVGLVKNDVPAISVLGIFKLSPPGWLLLAGLIAWIVFYFMDRWWYHRLLQGAVEHGRALEARLSQEVPGIGLTTDIGQASPFSLFGKPIRSSNRLDLFYSIIALVLVVMIISIK
jgi:hypothetical protein